MKYKYVPFIIKFLNPILDAGLAIWLAAFGVRCPRRKPFLSRHANAR